MLFASWSLITLEKYSIDITAEEIAFEWVNLLKREDYVFTAEKIALNNLKAGIPPPQSGILNNFYFDTSVSATRFYIKKVGKLLGFDRILFGSDCPYSDQEVELLKIKKLDISEKNMDLILEGNAVNVLGLK